MSSLLIATALGPTPWVALPIFTTREFFHTRILVRADAGIAVPADLAGKRVGVPEFQQTAAIWGRGVLEHEFGVPMRAMEFFMERVAEKSHGGATGFKPPPGVTVHQIPGDHQYRRNADARRTRCDAALYRQIKIWLTAAASIWRPTRVRPLFDRLAEGRRYYAKTGIYPINHAVVVRRSLVEQHPWIALKLYAAWAARAQVLGAGATALASIRDRHARR